MQDERFTNTPHDPRNPTDSRPRPDQAMTSDQLRSAIDQGAGADKVRHPDPAAAPLGTDDEAAGTPPTPEQRRMAAAQEIRTAPAPAADPVETGFNWVVPAIIAIMIGILGLILFLTWPA
jgi:hypothetical protein